MQEERSQLQKELGSDYAIRNQNIARYIKDHKMESDVDALVSAWGFSKAFRFLDRYASLDQSPSAGDTFSKEEERSTSGIKKADEFYSDKDFYKKLDKGDREVIERLRNYAVHKASTFSGDLY